MAAPAPNDGVASVLSAVSSNTASRHTLGRTAKGREVVARIYPGRAPVHRVVILAGVHGSEQGGIEVVERIEARLSTGRPRPTVVVIPVLFPDHAARRLREPPKRPTNRNFPPPGTTWPSEARKLRDALDRPAHPENVWLVRLIDGLQPERIVSVHGTIRREAAGVFSDPHVWPADLPRATARSDADAALAITVAKTIAETDPGLVMGNHLDTMPTAGWSGGVNDGVSLGRWAPHPVPDVRASVGVLTVEVPGNDRSDDLTEDKQRARRRQLDAFADAIVRHVLDLK